MQFVFDTYNIFTVQQKGDSGPYIALDNQQADVAVTGNPVKAKKENDKNY